MLACCALARAQEVPATGVFASLEPEMELAGARIAELDARPGVELVLLGAHGEVVTYGWDKESASLRALGEGITLADPEHCLVALGERWGGGGKALFATTSQGTRVHGWTDGRGFDGEGTLVAPRARFSLRTTRPMFAPILSDVDGDGTSELLVPEVDACEIWSVEHDEAKDRWVPRRVARVSLRAQHDEEEAVEALSDELESSFSIPGTATSMTAWRCRAAITRGWVDHGIRASSRRARFRPRPAPHWRG